MEMNLKKNIICIICIVLIFSCTACSNNIEDTIAINISISEESETNNFFTIDNNLRISFSQEITYTQFDTNKINLLNKNNDTIGGIEKYEYHEESLPSLIDPNIDYFQFLESIGLQIDPTELTAYTLGTGLYHGWEIWLHSDIMDMTHNLIPCNNYLYNIWFDTSKITSESCSQTIESIHFLQ